MSGDKCDKVAHLIERLAAQVHGHHRDILVDRERHWSTCKHPLCVVNQKRVQELITELNDVHA